MKPRFVYYICLIVFSANVSYAQWSTSTRAESTLYVCPGFYPGILTFEDGSSVVLGALYHSIYARKLDEFGFYQWTPPVLVHFNDSSAITETIAIGDWGGWISDGDGGVILFWYDHRGAYDTGTEFANNAVYVQRVDRFGVVRWTPGGVLAKGPQTGRKKGGIVSDGQGGCVVAWSESEFGFPGAQNKERTRIQRISSTGSMLWERVLDSSNTQYSLGYGNIVRAQDRLFFLSTAGARILFLNGTVFTEFPLGGFGLLIAERDSLLHNSIVTGQVRYDSLGDEYRELRQTKLTMNLDTIWTVLYWVKSGPGTLLFNPRVTDGNGGVYAIRTRIETNTLFEIRRIDQRGEVWESELIVQNTLIPTGGYDGHGGVLVGDQNAKVWRFDSLANPVWATNPVTLLTDPGNAYFPLFRSDNNGGMIMVFWTTRGGIFAHHSGRNGQIGIITNVPDGRLFPEAFTLEQNFPNPFNASTAIQYTLLTAAKVRLEVFDILGRMVATLVDDKQGSGKYNVAIDASRWASGVYFYRLRTETNLTDSKKMILIK